jgi:hypothetical protein
MSSAKDPVKTKINELKSKVRYRNNVNNINNFFLIIPNSDFIGTATRRFFKNNFK